MWERDRSDLSCNRSKQRENVHKRTKQKERLISNLDPRGTGGLWLSKKNREKGLASCRKRNEKIREDAIKRYHLKDPKKSRRYLGLNKKRNRYRSKGSKRIDLSIFAAP